MAKKSNQDAKRRNSPLSVDSILLIGDAQELIVKLEGLAKFKVSSDYQKMPLLGKRIIALKELVNANESEDLSHYILYSENRWRHVKEFLSLIGAVKSANLINEVEGMFVDGRLPVAMSDRLTEFIRIENDPAQSMFLRRLIDEWHLTGENIPAMVSGYVRSHRNELQALVSYHAGYVNSVRLLSDEEILQKAFEQEGNPFDGFMSNLLDCNRLPLLLRLAGDENCPTRIIFIKSLYAICGNIGSQIIAGNIPDHLDQLKDSILSTSCSNNYLLKEWSERCGEYIENPTPEIALAWMGEVFM